MYVGYADDDESPASIMAKFAALEEAKDGKKHAGNSGEDVELSEEELVKAVGLRVGCGVDYSMVEPPRGPIEAPAAPRAPRASTSSRARSSSSRGTSPRRSSTPSTRTTRARGSSPARASSRRSSARRKNSSEGPPRNPLRACRSRSGATSRSWIFSASTRRRASGSCATRFPSPSISRRGSASRTSSWARCARPRSDARTTRRRPRRRSRRRSRVSARRLSFRRRRLPVGVARLWIARFGEPSPVRSRLAPRASA